MKHIHHIIPRHMNGTDDPTNLIELAIGEHADAHLKLYEQYHKPEDYIAYRALSGLITIEELMSELHKLGRKITDTKLEEKYGPLWRSILSAMGSKKGIEVLRKNGWGVFDPTIRKRGVKAALHCSARNKRKESFKRIGHQRGIKNSNYGNMWITDGANNKLIKKTVDIPIGWKKGRVNNSAL